MSESNALHLVWAVYEEELCALSIRSGEGSRWVAD